MRRAGLGLLALLAAGCGGRGFDTVAEGRWDDDDGLLGLDHPERGRGDLTGPQALAALDDRLLVLDPARSRVVEVPLERPRDFTVAAREPFLEGALDLAVEAGGAWWVQTADCRCARRYADGAFTDVPLAEELFAQPLVVLDESRVAIGDPDLHEVHGVWLGGPRTPDEQRDAIYAGLPDRDLWRAVIPAPPARAITLQRGFDEVDVPLPGLPITVRLLALSCDETAVVVVESADGDRVLHTLVRFDLEGAVLYERTERAPDPYFTPLRPFSASPEGRVFQLRVEQRSYAIVEWETGCE